MSNPPYYSNPPPIINDYYNVQPRYYSNPSYYSGLEGSTILRQWNSGIKRNICQEQKIQVSRKCNITSDTVKGLY